MSEPRPSLRLSDIAEAVGVSRTTVSNAFNRPDQLSEDLRTHILQTASAMGYAGPNPMARMLRTGRAGAIGIVFPEILPYAFNDPAAVLFLEGIAQVCEEAESGLLFLPRVGASAAERMVQEAAVDGFIVYSIPDDSPLIARVLERRLPTVIVDQAALPGIAAVKMDDVGGAEAAAAHVLDQGHRHLGILGMELDEETYTGPVTPARRRTIAYATTRERLEGYEAAFRTRGLDPDAVPMHTCRNREEAGTEAARALLQRTPRPTALLAMSDRLAIGALQAAGELGLRVPGDLALIGFDDIPLAAHTDPPLSTIRQPHILKGIEAARRILQTPQDTSTLTLPTELMVRASTG